MKYDDAFYASFKHEMESLKKEAALPLIGAALGAGRALLTGGRLAGAASRIAGGARAAGTAVKAGGKGILSKVKNVAGTAAQNIPFMGGGQPKQKKSTTYV